MRTFFSFPPHPSPDWACIELSDGELSLACSLSLTALSVEWGELRLSVWLLLPGPVCSSLVPASTPPPLP